jgi:hypothetical protein
MSRLEKGGTNTTYLTLLIVSAALKLSISELLDGI